MIRKFELREFAIVICLGVTLVACKTDPIGSNEVVSCSRVYILVDDAMKREYERYVPVAMDWTYFFTEYGFRHGGTERVYRFDRNIYINRRKIDVENKIVTEANYIEACGENRTIFDTIYLMVDNGETYSEYLIQETFDLISDGESVAMRNKSGDSELQVDYSMKQGQWSNSDSTMPRIVVRKTSEFDCHKIHQVTRFQKQDSTNESFIKGIGSMHRRTPKMDVRLKLINDMPIESYLDKACK